MPDLPAPPGFRWEGLLLVPDPDSLPFASERNGQVDLSALRESESCATCRRLLDAIERLDEPERSQALVEYGQYTAAVDDPEAGLDELRAALRGAPALRRLLSEELGVEDLEDRLADLSVG